MANDYRVPQNMDEWMRQIEKRLQRQERRLGGTIGGTISEDGTAFRVPDPLAPIVPTDPPESSPDITVTPSMHGFTVVAAGVVAPSTTLDYYLDTVLVRSTRSTVEFFDKDVEGNAFTDETLNHSFYVIARNEVGSADPSNTVITHIDPTVDDEFVKAVIRTGFLLAGQIQVGNITIDPDNGIQIPLSNGGLISLPADGSPAEFLRVILQATQLLVEDKFELRGANNRISGSLNLSTGVGTPSTAPTVSAAWPDPVLTAPYAWAYDFRGLADGGTYWIVARRNTAAQILAIDKTTGVVTILASADVLGLNGSTQQVWNYTEMNGHHFAIVAALGGPDTARTVKEFDETWTAVREWLLPVFTNRRAETISGDGTYLYIGYGSTVSGNYSVQIVRIPATGSAGRQNIALNPNFETNTAGWAQLGGAITRSTTVARTGIASLRLESLPSRTNQVTNPSFEVDLTDWSAAGGLNAIARVAGGSVGGYALRANITASGVGATFSYLKSFTVTAGAAHNLSFDAKSAVGRPVQVVFFWYDASGTSLNSGTTNTNTTVTVTTSTAWTRKSVSVVPPARAASARILITVQNIASTTEYHYFDAFLFEKASSAGSYFDGSSPNCFWTGTPNASQSIVHAPATVQGYTTPTTPTTAGNTYSASAYFQASINPASVRVAIWWYDSTLTYMASTDGAFVTDAAGTWTRATVTGTAPPGSVAAIVMVLAANVPRAEYHYVDSVLFEQSDTVGDYFDGSTVAAGMMHYWSGTADGSSSYEFQADSPFTTPASGAGALPASLVGMYVGTADFGGERVVLSYSGGAMVWDMAGANQSDQGWVGTGIISTGFIWDSVTGRIFTMSYTSAAGGSYNSLIYQMSARVASTLFAVAYSQYDSNPSGGTHETAMSPAVGITVGARQVLKVITPEPQGSGDVDEPDSIRHYIQTGGAGGYYRQPDVTAPPWTVLYETPLTTGATTVSTPDFTGVGNPGVLQAAEGNTWGPLFQFTGKGGWRIASLVGAMMPWAGVSPTAPDGFLLCDGSAYLRAEYPELAAVLGHPVGGTEALTLYYGAPTADTFNVPNFSGRAPVGLDESQTEFDTLGETGGNKTVDATHVHSHAHTHSIPGHTHALFMSNNTTTGGSASRTNDAEAGSPGTLTSGGASVTNTSDPLTSLAALNNLQPYLTTQFIIATGLHVPQAAP